MSTNINLRKKHFTQDLLDHLGALPDGSSAQRKKRKAIARSIAEDLAHLNKLPVRLKNLNSESVLNLVDHWKKNELKPKTIKNRLGVLRGLLSTLEKPLAIPTNKQLNIIVHKPRSVNKYRLIDPNTIPFYPISIVKEICNLQYLFGLKLHEATKINSSMIHDTHLEVHHSLSFNKKDRRVPIESVEQKEFAQNFIINLKDILPVRKQYYPSFIALYRYTEAQIKIPHEDYFRHRYIYRRYQDLLSRYDQFTALEIVTTEVGYSKVGQIKGILACQENF